ncbi:aminodeoxychorismate lyase [Serratia symbiotica str. 'Cinara cedri']|nr:aminodeoxychorismate lyase [Serratia symbiotica str. 'Cinara cedri']
MLYCYQRIKCFAETPLAIKQETIFQLPVGSGSTALQRLLIRNNLVRSCGWLPWLLRVEPELIKFKAGTYRLTPGMTVRQILQLLANGKETQFTVRLIEGLRLRDWLQILKQSKYLHHTLDNKNDIQIASELGILNEHNLEGRFFPDTYQYTAGMSDIELLKRAYLRMNEALQSAWIKRDTSLPYKSPTDLLILASIIEKETALPQERSKVASVFVNRLRIGMRLQTDATITYGIKDNYNAHITRKDIETATAYNTYIIFGLPPTPIAMPCEAALQAAANPDKTSYLYFVANGNGGHTFTTNLASHNQAVRTYRQRLKEKNEK